MLIWLLFKNRFNGCFELNGWTRCFSATAINIAHRILFSGPLRQLLREKIKHFSSFKFNKNPKTNSQLGHSPSIKELQPFDFYISK